MNKPGSIFGSYGSQEEIIEIGEDTVVNVLEEDEEEILIEVEDKVHFIDDYNRLKNKPTLNGVEIVGNKTSEDFHISEGGSGEITPATPDNLGGVKAEYVENINENLVDAQINASDDHLYVAAVAYGKEQELTKQEQYQAQLNINTLDQDDDEIGYDIIYNLF